MRARLKGLIFTFVGTLAFTPDTLLVRLVNTDPMTMIAIRGILMAVSIAVCLLLFFRKKVRGYVKHFSVYDGIFAIIFAVTMFFFVFALSSTSVATVLVFISTAPVFAALIAHYMLGEKVSRQAALAISVSMIGIIVVAWGESNHGTIVSNFSFSNVAGSFFSLVTAVLIGLNMVVRKRSTMDNSMPALVIGGMIAGFLSLPFSNFSDLTNAQIDYALLLGLVVMPIACTCTFIGPRYLPASEVSMISLLEVVIAPVWIWVVIAEVPKGTTVVGGAIVISSVLAYITLVSSDHRPTVYSTGKAKS